MPPRVFATRAVSLALLALLLPGDSSPGPRSVEASAVATDDACFYDVASGTCVASAVWVTGQHGLLRTPRANLLADVAAGIGIKYSGDERGPRRTPRGASRTAVDFDLTREVGSLLEREDA